MYVKFFYQDAQRSCDLTVYVIHYKEKTKRKVFLNRMLFNYLCKSTNLGTYILLKSTTMI